MKISTQLQGWELEKALYLIKVAKDLNMQLGEFTIVDVNNTTGNVYLWDENYMFSLYMPINCELQKSDVYVLYTDFDNGDEIEIDLADITNVDEIEYWINDIENNK